MRFLKKIFLTVGVALGLHSSPALAQYVSSLNALQVLNAPDPDLPLKPRAPYYSPYSRVTEEQKAADLAKYNAAVVEYDKLKVFTIFSGRPSSNQTSTSQNYLVDYSMRYKLNIRYTGADLENQVILQKILSCRNAALWNRMKQNTGFGWSMSSNNSVRTENGVYVVDINIATDSNFQCQVAR